MLAQQGYEPLVRPVDGPVYYDRPLEPLLYFVFNHPGLNGVLHRARELPVLGLGDLLVQLKLHLGGVLYRLPALIFKVLNILNSFVHCLFKGLVLFRNVLIHNIACLKLEVESVW